MSDRSLIQSHAPSPAPAKAEDAQLQPRPFEESDSFQESGFQLSKGIAAASAPIPPPNNPSSKLLLGHSFGNIRVGSSSPFPIQAQLEIGKPDDPYEREADAVAENVMRMPDPTEQPLSFSQVQSQYIQRNTFLLGYLPPFTGRQLDFLTIKQEEGLISHRWIEVDGQESYGWWPRNREADVSDLALLGTEGELNAVSHPRTRGTPTRDPHHGEAVSDVYHPFVVDNSKTDDQIRREVRQFAQGFSGDYRVLGGPNCHTFIDSMSSSVGLSRNTGNEMYSPLSSPEIMAKEEPGIQPSVSVDLEAQLNQKQGGGSSLPASFRSFIEPRIGFSFGNVKVHTDSTAVQMNQALGARAFTHGNNIYFNSSQYDPQSDSGKQLLAHELTHVVQQTGETRLKADPSLQLEVQRQSSGEENLIQCDGEFANRPPTAIEASGHSFAGRDAMSEFLAGSSERMLETQTELQNTSPASSEEAEQYRAQIERLISLNAIGLMASHKATIAARREAMFSNQVGQSRVQPLRDAAVNIHRLEEVKEQLEEYLRNLRTVESNALMRRGDLGDCLDELALSSNRIMSAEIRQGMVERYQSALESNSADTMWLFVYGSAGYAQRLRTQQVEAVEASLSLFFQNFPVFSQLDASNVANGEFENDQALEMQAQRSFAEVLLSIDETIRDIHSGDISPLDMPEVVRITRQELPPPLQAVLDEMKRSHENTRFWLNLGLTAAEILLAFVPVIGPALALGVGAANLAMQGEDMMDRMQMVEVGANPYGDSPLGVTEPSAFETTMFGVSAILTLVGAGAVVNSLRGGQAAVSTMEEVAEAAARGTDDLFEGGASVVDDLAEGATRSGEEAIEGGLERSGHLGGDSGSVSPPNITDDSMRLAETESDEIITLYHGTEQTGFEGLGGLDDGRISVTRSAGEHQDFSQGFYLSEDISVAESSARLRGAQRGGRMQHVLRYDISIEDLGVIVDVRRGGAHRELWDAFLDRSLVPELPQMGSVRDYLSRLGVEQRGIYFEEFLESIGMRNADTIMGPIGDSVTTGAVTSIRGESTQVVIRSQSVADRLNAIMRGE